MILFLEDWKKYPRAIVDTSTNNKSWVRIAGLFKELGVKNHAFLLALHNPELSGVDPYDSSLTAEQINMIAIEVAQNPWYFFREVVSLSSTGGANSGLEANRFNIALWWNFFNHITSLIVISRQVGKTTAILSLDSYILLTAVNTAIHLLTRSDDLRTKTIVDLKNILEGLPWYLRLKSNKDTYNTEKITIGALGNTYYTAVGQKSETAAASVGRGLTVACHRIDEFAFIDNNEISLSSLLPSATKARENAALNNSHYGNIFATTAGYLSTKSGEFAYKMYCDCLRWKETLYDCKDLKDLEETIKKNSPKGKLQVLIEYNHKQLGKTDSWLKSNIEMAMVEGERAEAEYLNIWSKGNESSPISKESLDLIYKSIDNDPYCYISKQGYIINWYIPQDEIKTRLCVAGLDTSDAVGNDDIAMCLRDVRTGEVVATGIFNETNILTFSEFLVDLLSDFTNIAVMIIERKSTGSSIIDNLIRMLPLRNIDPFKRLFNWVVNDAYENKNYMEEVVNKYLYNRDEETYIKYKKHFGYATSSTGRSSRDNLYGAAFNAVIKYNARHIRDKTLYEQLSRLVRKNGRIDHRQGEHDDMVISLLMTQYLLTNCNNLNYYGLNPKLILSSVADEIIKEEGGIESVIEKENQAAIMEEMYKLLDKARVEPNPIITTTLVKRVKHLSQMVDDKYKVNFNLDAILEEMKLKKKNIFKK